MSRIGKQPIAIPPKVKVDIKGQQVHIEGPKGKLDLSLPNRTSAALDNGRITVSRKGEDAHAKALHGLSRALLNNMVRGVNEGFSKRLEIHGVGFKAAVQGKAVNLSLGFSHPVVIEAPEGITFEVKENKITVLGADRGAVGEVAAKIRHLRPADPYKLKGFKYEGEKIIKKAGKAAKAGATTATK